MPAFIFKRIAQALLVLVVVVSATFLMVRLAPGSPFGAERKLDPAVEQRLNAHYHLDGSIPEQLLCYWRNLIHGDLGESLKYKNRTVVEILAQALPKSALVGSCALVLALGVGIVAGSLAAVYHNGPLDRAAMLLALSGICLPPFLLAPLAILVFGIYFQCFPVAGWGSLDHLVLPALCLAAPYAAYCSRLMRSSMLDVLDQDYIRTARAKGVSEQAVVFRHALKSAILPLVSFTGPLAANILTGSMVIEDVFKIPGLGPFFVNSVLTRDVFLLGGTVIVYFTVLITLNTCVDILYTVLDKRIKLL